MRRREFITLFAGTLAWAARGGRAATPDRMPAHRRADERTGLGGAIYFVGLQGDRVMSNGTSVTIIAVIGLAILPGLAHSKAIIPVQFVGRWCGTEENYILRGEPSYVNQTGDCLKDEDPLVIDNEGYGTRGAWCKVDSIKTWIDRGEARDTKNMGAPSIQINATCFDTNYKMFRREFLIMVLTKGTQMANGLGSSEIIAMASTAIAVGAMVVATMQAQYAKQAAKEAKRQADAALGEVPPLIFLDSITFANPQSLGGRAVLTFVNQNRRDVRLLDIEIETDPAILVSADTGELRDAIAAALQHSRKGEGAPLRIDLHEKHLVVRGS
jgi:hypothetical protein